MTIETCPCKWCGTPTTMTGTKMCDRCWELERRIRDRPEVAQRMLAYINNSPAMARYGEAVRKIIK